MWRTESAGLVHSRNLGVASAIHNAEPYPNLKLLRLPAFPKKIYRRWRSWRRSTRAKLCPMEGQRGASKASRSAASVANSKKR
jgi:hypothetical protein